MNRIDRIPTWVQNFPRSRVTRDENRLFRVDGRESGDGDTATLMPSLEPKTEGRDRRDSIGRSNSVSNARPCLGISISRSNANRLSAAG